MRLHKWILNTATILNIIFALGCILVNLSVNREDNALPISKGLNMNNGEMVVRQDEGI